jgi:hypothetical protein
VCQSAGKVMTCVFRDAEGVIRIKIHALEHNNQWNTYYDTPLRLRQAGRMKRPVHHSRERKFQHDNATPHSAPRTRAVSVVSLGTSGPFTLCFCPSCLIAECR